ncbi:hypothetical protein BHE74_00007039 [Ensete ventricosum]|nr:hypothetical protein GW17_00048905 [Ensete ventricosum]RWW84359.1 hypothetical protein BHE74_00007039 [Ensete ventricosum]RZR80338.1 hypothetical protein BHM03_00006363 [Ensete ventricosum]
MAQNAPSPPPLSPALLRPILRSLWTLAGHCPSVFFAPTRSGSGSGSEWLIVIFLLIPRTDAHPDPTRDGLPGQVGPDFFGSGFRIRMASASTKRRQSSDKPETADTSPASRRCLR